MKRALWFVFAFVLSLLVIGYVGQRIKTTAEYRENSRHAAAALVQSLRTGNTMAVEQMLRNLPPPEVTKAMAVLNANVSQFVGMDLNSIQPEIVRNRGEVFAICRFRNGVEIHHVQDERIAEIWHVVEVLGPDY